MTASSYIDEHIQLMSDRYSLAWLGKPYIETPLNNKHNFLPDYEYCMHLIQTLLFFLSFSMSPNLTQICSG